MFLDIILESEYDPLESNRKGIKLKTKHLNDPTTRDIYKTRCEDKLSGKTRPDTHMSGRETLDILQWGKGNIEATPHGFFSKMMDGQGSSKRSNTTASNVCLDDYAPPNNEALKAEFPRGKRIDITDADW
jgi:hypothetical protein